MSFEEFLVTKKIDSSAFRQAEPVRWTEWNVIFEQLSPVSFTAQKLYLINPIRRKYPLQVSEGTQPNKRDTPLGPSKPSKPVFKPKIN